MIISVDMVFRYTTISLFFLWWLYWQITEQTADKEKPKNTSVKEVWLLRKLSTGIVGFVLVVQLLGISFLPISASPFVLFIIHVIGFLFVVSGIDVAVSARRTLGTNWSHAYEYQIKKKQELVTTGVYRFIRHPIYTGLIFALVGGELLVSSYLSLCGVFFVIVGYQQAKKEEKILINHFGNAYKTYTKHTKMFLPFLW